jgi:hypothetical protein
VGVATRIRSAVSCVPHLDWCSLALVRLVRSETEENKQTKETGASTPVHADCSLLRVVELT